MQQWDLFLETTAILEEGFFMTHEPKYFKRVDGESYKLYRQVMQILDCAVLDIQTVQYKPKLLVCSMLYLILGKDVAIQVRSSKSLARSRSSHSSPALPYSSSRIITSIQYSGFLSRNV
jgi:hypothetical protein